MFKKLTTIGLLILALLLNGIVMNRGVNAVSYDSANPYLNVNVNSYAQVDNDCSNVLAIKDANHPGNNIRPAYGYMYGNDSCRIDFGYNDPTQTYEIKFGKTQPYDLYCTGTSCDCTAGVNCEFDNINNPTDYVMDYTGVTDDEEFGFHIDEVAVATGNIGIDPETGEDYNNTSFVYDVEYISGSGAGLDPDILIDSSAPAACPYGSCHFKLVLHANVSAYHVNNSGFTMNGAFVRFANSPYTDSFTVRVVLTTPNP